MNSEESPESVDTTAIENPAKVVRGPWSKEEDAILCDLVSKMGASNWGVIANGIPGRNGKSCRLRWFNQLDPSLKHKPFTEEEEGIITQAHAIHGNKWAIIKRYLPGRTDNAIKNHWNAKLRKAKPESASISPNHSTSSIKAYPLETPPEKFHILPMINCSLIKSPNSDMIVEDQNQISGNNNPMVSRPTPKHGAFTICKSSFGGLLTGASKHYGISNELVIPPKCGHGCCGSFASSRNSLMGPEEFVEYEELPSCSSEMLTSIASDLNSISWIRSGLQDSETGRRSEENLKNENFVLDRRDNLCTGVSTQALAIQTQVQGL